MQDLPAWAASIHHDGSPRYVTAGSLLGTTAMVRLRSGRDAPIERLFLRTCPDGEQAMAPMHRIDGPGDCQWWQGELKLQMPRTSYRFLLLTPDGGWNYTGAGLLRHVPPDVCDFRLLAGLQAPEWVREAVFYQIFPDRFWDGDPANNVRDGAHKVGRRSALARRWGELPNREHGSAEFFGGDLQGIIEKLPYLEDLGVTAIYLNPIFSAPSNHKYDVADYEHVDAHFGGDSALIALREALDQRGMRLMLDVVPNHCGVTHPWFVAAQADANAATAEFFTFRKHPDQYDTWLGVASLPKLNYRSERLRARMYADPDAILRRWLRPPFRIDGWRMDVANMLARQGESQLGHKIGRGVRRAVKSENPQAYLIGEHFFDGSAHLQGDELDASMNYRGFTFPLLQWLNCFDFPSTFQADYTDRHALPTAALAEQWRAFLAVIPWQIAIQQYNLLGSHDTPRIMTLVKQEQARAMLAASVLFCFPGVPAIYYGDEIGLQGERDPDCRRCMPWDAAEWNSELREHYRRLIALRRNSPALREGGFQILHAEGETIAFSRETTQESLLLVARRAPEARRSLDLHASGLPDGTPLHEVLSGMRREIRNRQLDLGELAVGAQIWRVAG